MSVGRAESVLRRLPPESTAIIVGDYRDVADSHGEASIRLILDFAWARSRSRGDLYRLTVGSWTGPKDLVTILDSCGDRFHRRNRNCTAPSIATARPLFNNANSSLAGSLAHQPTVSVSRLAVPVAIGCPLGVGNFDF